MKDHLHYLILAAILGTTLPMPSLAGPPPNDTFATPTLVTEFPATVFGTNTDATLEIDEPTPNLWAEASVWFQWNAMTSGAVQIDTLSSDFDTLLAVRTGSAFDALTLIDDNDDYGGRQSAVFINATSGVTYQITVYGWDNARGKITLNITNDITGKISGTVTGTNGPTPQQGIAVSANFWNGSWWNSIRSAETDASGNYVLTGLTAGTYRVQFRDSMNGNYIPEVYSNAVDLDTGADIVVAAETTVININASLAAASKISGTVTGTNGLTPLQDIEAGAYRWNGVDWTLIASAWTTASGEYSVGELAAGRYRVQFSEGNGNYVTEAYNNAVNLDAGEDIIVPGTTTVTGINGSLAGASKISGTVTETNGLTLLPNIRIEAFTWDGMWWNSQASAWTDASGNYTLSGLTAGTYRVQFNDWNGNYITEVYSNAADLNSGTDIAAPALTTVEDIDGSLEVASKISGTVSGPDGLTPLQGVKATAYGWDGWNLNWAGTANTDTSGQYTVGGLTAGTYRVQFRDWQNGNYAIEAYSNAADLNSGTDIVIPMLTTVTGIDAWMENASKITGTITGPDGLTPLRDIAVEVYCWDGSWRSQSWWGWTDTNGYYSFGGLTAGTYRVQFSDWDGHYTTEVYSNVVDLDSGTDVILLPLSTVSNINASLEMGTPLEPPVLVGLRHTNPSDFELRFSGIVGADYTLQEVAVLTNEWGDIGPPINCAPGTNVLPRTSSASQVFWRLKMLP